MPVKITPKFTVTDIRKVILQRKQIILDAVTNRLQRIGEQFVNDARENGSYQDRTGNLRSSIGYVILYNGKQLLRDFDGTKDGVRFAKKAIADISKKYPTGFILIVVAGAQYAYSVESKGYEVLSMSGIAAAERLKASMKQLQQSINKF